MDILEFYTNKYDKQCDGQQTPESSEHLDFSMASGNTDISTLINKTILCEEIKLIGQLKYFSNTDFNIIRNHVTFLLQYMRSAFERCKTMDIKEKKRTIMAMRCTIQFYLLILKMGGDNIIFTKIISGTYDKNTYFYPTGHCTKYNRNGEVVITNKNTLNIIIIENYVKNLIKCFALSAYDIIGVEIYMKRMMRLKQHILNWYYFDSCAYIMPTIILLYRKACGNDIIYCNDMYASRMMLDKIQINIVEVQLILDILLYVDDMECENLLCQMSRDLKLGCL